MIYRSRFENLDYKSFKNETQPKPESKLTVEDLKKKKLKYENSWVQDRSLLNKNYIAHALMPSIK